MQDISTFSGLSSHSTWALRGGHPQNPFVFFRNWPDEDLGGPNGPKEAVENVEKLLGRFSLPCWFRQVKSKAKVMLHSWYRRHSWRLLAFSKCFLWKEIPLDFCGIEVSILSGKLFLVCGKSIASPSWGRTSSGQCPLQIRDVIHICHVLLDRCHLEHQPAQGSAEQGHPQVTNQAANSLNFGVLVMTPHLDNFPSHPENTNTQHLATSMLLAPPLNIWMPRANSWKHANGVILTCFLRIFLTRAPGLIRPTCP